MRRRSKKTASKHEPSPCESISPIVSPKGKSRGAAKAKNSRKKPQITSVKNVTVANVKPQYDDDNEPVSQLLTEGIVSEKSTLQTIIKGSKTFKLTTAVISDGSHSVQTNYWGQQATQAQQTIQPNQALSVAYDNNKLQWEDNPARNSGTCDFTINNPIATPNMNDDLIDEYKLDLQFSKLNELSTIYKEQLECNMIVKVLEDKTRSGMSKYGNQYSFQSLKIADETGIGYYRCKFPTVIPEDKIIIIANANVVVNKQYYNLENGFVVDADIVDLQFDNEKQKILKAQIKTGHSIDIDAAMQVSLKKLLEKRREVNQSQIEIDQKYLLVVICDLAFLYVTNDGKEMYYINKNGNSKKAVNPDDYDEEDLQRQVRLDCIFQDGKRTINLAIWSSLLSDFFGQKRMSAEKFCQLSPKERRAKIQKLKQSKFDLYVQSKIITHKNGRIQLKSNVVKVEKHD